jgi:hypothetical protein
MKKIFILFSIIVSFTLTSKSVFASAPAPSPECYIEGIIQSVEVKEAYDEPCLVEKYGCPTDMELQHPARYFLKIRIDSVSYISGETKFTTCENKFPLNSEKSIFINKDKIKAGDSFGSGQKIKGQVSSFGNPSLDSYELESLPKDSIDKKNDRMIDDQQKSNIISFLSAGFLIAIIFVITAWFLIKKRK